MATIIQATRPFPGVGSLDGGSLLAGMDEAAQDAIVRQLEPFVHAAQDMKDVAGAAVFLRGSINDSVRSLVETGPVVSYARPFTRATLSLTGDWLTVADDDLELHEGLRDPRRLVRQGSVDPCPLLRLHVRIHRVQRVGARDRAVDSRIAERGEVNGAVHLSVGSMKPPGTAESGLQPLTVT
jgi:hypothetical protein